MSAKTVAAPRVLVVGAGLTGAIAARRLLASHAVHVELWDSAAAVGGRMRNEVLTTDGHHLLTDSGAQYITMAEGVAEIPAHSELYAGLRGAGLLTAMKGRIQGGRAADGDGTNFVCRGGFTSMVSWLLETATASERPPVSLGRSVESLDLVRTDGAARWRANYAGASAEYDAVVLTPPAPELLPLLGGGDGAAWLDATAEGALRPALEGLQFSSRYALRCETQLQPISSLQNYYPSYLAG